MILPITSSKKGVGHVTNFSLPFFGNHNMSKEYSVSLLLHQCPSVHPSVTRVDCAQTKQCTKIIIKPPESSFLHIGLGARSPLLGAVFDAKFQDRRPPIPRKNKFRRIHIRPQRLNCSS
jgi:hypothetical protein